MRRTDISSENNGVGFIKGTIILAIQYKEGLVVCADKRVEHWTGELVDGVTKLKRLGKRGVFSVTGSPIHIEKKDGTELFNVFSIVDYFSRNKEVVDLNQAVSDLKKALEDKFLTYINARKKEDWPESGAGPNHLLFKLVLFNVNSRREIQTVFVKLYYDKDALSPVKVVSEDFPQARLISPLIIDNPGPVTEIVSGTDKRFDSIRANPTIRRFVQDRPLPCQISLEEAVAFGKEYIEANSEISRLMFNDPKLGWTSDCAILRFEEGLIWASQGAKIKG
jgi:hypothetical protein